MWSGVSRCIVEVVLVGGGVPVEEYLVADMDQDVKEQKLSSTRAAMDLSTFVFIHRVEIVQLRTDEDDRTVLSSIPFVLYEQYQ